jgi:PilZ domain
MNLNSDFRSAAQVWRSEPGDEPNPLLEAIVTETQTAALLTATIASFANALHLPGTVRTQAELQMYLPLDPAVITGFRRWASEANLSTRAAESVSAFFADLGPARRQMQRYFADANSIGLDRAGALHRLTLTSAWRGTCKSAAAAVKDLASETELDLPDLYHLSAGILGRILEAAASGATPCINAEGAPFLPALPQRRNSVRRMIGQTARVTAAGRTVQAYVRDVSAGGFGLQQIAVLDVGQVLSIELATGRRFTGTVVWYRAGRAGIRLSRTLPPNDPLLWG